MKFKEGDWVLIEGRRTRLVTKLTSIEGGWIVCPKILNFGYWNEQEMTKTR
jgi:hypothetical protein